MRNFTVVAALLLCSLSWISVSGSESHTVDVQPGEEVTLLCSNYTSSPTKIHWYRVVKRSLPHCVCSMFKADESASLCSGFKDGKFEMSSNSSTLFLKIKHVNSSDSGLYFCGYTVGRDPVIVSATYLDVQVSDETANLTSAVLGCLTVLLIVVVICLAVKIKKPQRAGNDERNPQRGEILDSDHLNEAVLSLYSPTIRNRRPASEREVETRVIYTAVR